MAQGFRDGSKLFRKRAKQALPLLVAQAKAENTITYGLLARGDGKSKSKKSQLRAWGFGTRVGKSKPEMAGKDSSDQFKCLKRLVGERGFEPPTP